MMYLENVPCIVEKMGIMVLLSSVLVYSSMSTCIIVLFKSSIPFLIFYLVILSVIERGVLNHLIVKLFLPLVLLAFAPCILQLCP